MTRYRVLREMGCDIITAAIVGWGNDLFGAPKGKIYVLHMEIDYTDLEENRK